MQRQHCHSEEIGRSTKNLLLYGYRFLTALRLSFSSLRSRGRLRPLRSLRSSIRFAQNDKVSLSGIRAQPAGHACGPPPAKAAARTAQNSRPTHRHSLQKPLFRILRCIPPSDCFIAPATGCRNRDDGAMTGVGTNGFVWTSSSSAASGSGAIYVGCLHFDANSVEPLYEPHRAYGRSVRCVQASARLFFFWVKVGGVGAWVSKETRPSDRLPSAPSRRLSRLQRRLSPNVNVAEQQNRNLHDISFRARTRNMGIQENKKTTDPAEGPSRESGRSD